MVDEALTAVRVATRQSALRGTCQQLRSPPTERGADEIKDRIRPASDVIPRQPCGGAMVFAGMSY